MFGLSPGTTILSPRPTEDDDPFFEGTWMDALGILYADVSGEERDVSVVMDPDLDRAGRPSLSVAFQGEAVADYRGQLNAMWTSPDGATSITREFINGSDTMKVVIAGLLDIDIVTSREQELLADPPIHFLNFFINSMAVGPSVHGMYAPGAVEDRLAMGTLEGLRHREYVEGTDDDYQTSALTSPDCSFNRFGQAPNGGGELSNVTAVGDSSLVRSNDGPRRLLRALDSGRTIAPSARCRRLENRNAFECALGEAACAKCSISIRCFIKGSARTGTTGGVGLRTSIKEPGEKWNVGARGQWSEPERPRVWTEVGRTQSGNGTGAAGNVNGTALSPGTDGIGVPRGYDGSGAPRETEGAKRPRCRQRRGTPDWIRPESPGARRERNRPEGETDGSEEAQGRNGTGSPRRTGGSGKSRGTERKGPGRLGEWTTPHNPGNEREHSTPRKKSLLKDALPNKPVRILIKGGFG
ncbi:hypothetical protein KFL_000040090 [Klebsormidium nitens]|uniref:Uncharacterized protein n=1 Tax=Klebsormidium nitens TaxID=105231 RepID=A0A1Y1HPQ8_KLENI|nr:hypothetical protein KFL_000040090 [Klebsormidium nitens]|eukprot:GAQ77808.1 hypothetical protein KFL_000040090 [Klebsormidium nitens]